MRKLTETELTRADMIEVHRTAINLKHRLAARRERNEILPDLEDKINNAIANGQPFELTIGEIFDEA